MEHVKYFSIFCERAFTSGACLNGFLLGGNEYDTSIWNFSLLKQHSRKSATDESSSAPNSSDKNIVIGSDVPSEAVISDITV